MGALEPFVLLRDPGAYRACPLDLVADADARVYWTTFFHTHMDVILGMAIAQEPTDDARVRADACAADLRAQVAAFAAAPGDFGRVTLFTMDRWRDDILLKHGFPDPFRDQKARENAHMAPLLPGVLAELDASDDPVGLAVRGVFAGNIFDMGAAATARTFADASPDFRRTRETLTSRPWAIDDLDALRDRLDAKPPRHAVVFADNAGSDFVLGIVPFVRLLCQRGAHVTLACNEDPSLNDVTAAEVRALWPTLDGVGGTAGLDVHIVSTGTGDPLIDLSAVSQELNDAARGADLVVLEGMGRGVESNLDADLVCDRANLAMLKDAFIAAHVGGVVFDCVCRFVPAAR